MVPNGLVVEAALVSLPMQAGAAMDTLLSGPLGTLIAFLFQVIVFVLLCVTLFNVAGVGISQASMKSHGQKQAGDYAVQAGIVLVSAALVVVGPAVLADLGFPGAEHLSVIDF